MTFISYAQNFEDVLLNRVFKGKTKGFYIDVGALHPTFDSITKAFYDRGWSGINIEPIKEKYNIFQKERLRDINLNIALSNSEGNLEFFQVLGQPGNSTLNKEIAYAIAQEKGFDISRYTVVVKTLADICKEYVNEKIDFLKIDVEGLEEQVVLGGNWEIFRPSILVIETTLPNTNIRCENNIPVFLKNKAYEHVFFDGINDYYIAEESIDLQKHFAYPVNILDFYANYRLIDQQIQINDLIKILD
jgi:FkbM family methyltransferase